MKYSLLLKYLIDQSYKRAQKFDRQVSGDFFMLSFLELLEDLKNKKVDIAIHSTFAGEEIKYMEDRLLDLNINKSSLLSSLRHSLDMEDTLEVDYQNFVNITKSELSKNAINIDGLINCKVFFEQVIERPTSIIFRYIQMGENDRYITELNLEDENVIDEDLANDVYIGNKILDEELDDQENFSKRFKGFNSLNSDEETEANNNDEKVEQTNGGTEEFLAKIIKESEVEYKKTRINKKNDGNIKQKENKGKNLDKLLNNSIYKTRNLQNKLLKDVYGQNTAVNTFVSSFFKAELEESLFDNRNKPRAVFLFAGPSGVGKTFLAEKVSQYLKLPFKRFDMSEYSDKESTFEFSGSSQVYKNAQEGLVTSYVAHNPKSILLFDEIDKAHLNVINLFLQILDDGRLRDSFTDKEVDFTNTIIILTTNAGKQLYEDDNFKDLSLVSQKTIIKALSDDINPINNLPYFPRAICSRLASGNIIMFNKLGVDNLLKIISNEFEKQIESFNKNIKLNIEIDKNVPYCLLYAEGANIDARSIKGKASNFIYKELYELFRLMISDKYKMNVSNVKNIYFNVDIPQNDEINKLFSQDNNTGILVFCKKTLQDRISALCKGYNMFFADKIETAKIIVSENKIGLILCDPKCEIKKKRNVLNIEDTISEGRTFIDYIKKCTDIPVYIIQSKENEITSDELLSFAKVGVKGLLIAKTGNNHQFINSLSEINKNICQENTLLELAKTNKVLTFNTSQMVSKEKDSAFITLDGLKLEKAIDANDGDDIITDVSKPDVKFASVIGAEDAKAELSYFVNFLKDPTHYIKNGVKMPKGVLLYGPPGTGKTMLAKAMAGESNATFIIAEGNQFLKRYVGEGAKMIHSIFAKARKYAPSILFIDEIDAIAKLRLNNDNVDSSEALNAFLTEIDGFSSKSDKPVFVLAATNYDINPNSSRTLDPALLRRFDRRILIDLPTKKDRYQFIEQKILNNNMYKVSKNEIENIVVRSINMSLADLDSIFEFALRNAIKNENFIVDDNVIEEAFEAFNNGEAKETSEDELLRVARHEAGHTLVSWLYGKKPSYVSIVARGTHGGYMQQIDGESKNIFTKQELLNRIDISLAGRASEITYYGEDDGVSSSASGDLQNATTIAQNMICSYGMFNDIGLNTFDFSKNKLSDDIDKKIKEILKSEMAKTIEIVKQNKKMIDKLVKELLLKSHLRDIEIDSIFSK